MIQTVGPASWRYGGVIDWHLEITVTENSAEYVVISCVVFTPFDINMGAAVRVGSGSNNGAVYI